jgi:hypothetical protein
MGQKIRRRAKAVERLTDERTLRLLAFGLELPSATAKACYRRLFELEEAIERGELKEAEAEADDKPRTAKKSR